MNLKDLYMKKKLDRSIQLKYSNLNSLIDEFELNVEDLKYLLLLIDGDTDEDVFTIVRDALSCCSREEKEVLFCQLINYSDEINIEAFAYYFSSDDFIVGRCFFSKILDDKGTSFVDKYLLFDAILDSGIIESDFNFYIESFFSSSKKVLTNPISHKTEVRYAVALLRKVIKKYNKRYVEANDILTELYVDNDLWSKYYQEEIEYRQTVLTQSFGKKVSDALRNKDYEKVVKLIGKYEKELPKVLKRKLDFSLKKLDIE